MAEAPGVGQRNGLQVKTGVIFPGCLRVRSIRLLPGAPPANSGEPGSGRTTQCFCHKVKVLPTVPWEILANLEAGGR